MVKRDEHPSISGPTSFWVYEINDEQGLFCSRTLSANLAQFIAGDRVAFGSGVFDLNPILVPDSAVSFQVTDGSAASLTSPPEGLHHLVLLCDGGSLVLLGRDLLELGFWFGGVHRMELAVWDYVSD